MAFSGSIYFQSGLLFDDVIIGFLQGAIKVLNMLLDVKRDAEIVSEPNRNQFMISKCNTDIGVYTLKTRIRMFLTD